jgi:diadenosine tetraphosphate (Ap4A) HIT family hydrolase
MTVYLGDHRWEMTGEADSRGCPLCVRAGTAQVLASNALALAVPDGYPLSLGHSLVIPRRHVADLFDLDSDEQAAVWTLVAAVREVVQRSHGPAGFNVGANVGAAAGQTVAHAHVHVIPRYVGDVPDPRGGVRWVLPERADYWSGLK